METFTKGIIFVFLFWTTFLVGVQIALEYFFPDLQQEYIKFIASLMKVEEETITWENAIWTIIFPFVASLTIIYALLDQIKIFGSGPSKDIFYFIIAFVWAGSLIQTGALSTWVMWIYNVGALWSIIIILFLIGIGSVIRVVLTRFVYGWARFRGARATAPSIEVRPQLDAEIQDIQNRLRKLEQQRADLIKKMSDIPTEEFKRRMSWIEGQIKGYNKKMEELIEMSGKEEAMK